MAADGVMPQDLRRRLRTTRLGRRIYYLPETDSTNRVAAELARDGEGDGTLVISDYQRAGRGRHERSWVSPPHRNLLFSLILRPQLPFVSALALTLAFSLAIVRVLSRISSQALLVKWPNDVLCANAKVCGILAESASKAGAIEYVVVGIGINVNMDRGDVAAVGVPAASLLTITGVRHSRADVLAQVLGGIEDAYLRYLDDGFAVSVREYDDLSVLRGKTVQFKSGQGTERGKVLGVAADGGLRVQSDSGERVLYDHSVMPV